MNKTKIEWCDSSWNPATGCLHKCEYCYARTIAHRFETRKGAYCDLSYRCIYHRNGLNMPVLDEPVMFKSENPEGGHSGIKVAILIPFKTQVKLLRLKN